MNYKNMTNEEIKEQLEWSDSHEFSYGYSMWAFKEIERLNENNQAMQEEMARAWEKLDKKESIIKEAIKYIKKEITCYSDSEIDDLIDILQGSDKE